MPSPQGLWTVFKQRKYALPTTRRLDHQSVSPQSPICNYQCLPFTNTHTSEHLIAISNLQSALCNHKYHVRTLHHRFENKDH